MDEDVAVVVVLSVVDSVVSALEDSEESSDEVVYVVTPDTADI
ncbi:hypothetical protein [Sporomusa malonica]|uniref:Uncharacterized protein n=1 Tax=Sporomusa malonica TaxID=112901 RepID=A0A1W2DEB1_9FIRM|nr:hypothetical protein [Sporomusa malonica]SMC95821.1 hypothetical protein SAMN04488500_11554 [Sporomusa malonica]